MERLFGQPHPPSQRGSVEAALAQAHKEAVQKREAKQAAKLQAKAELEAMFSPDEQAVLREMDAAEAELFQLEASMEQMGGMPPPSTTYPIDWRGVQVSEVALELLLKSGWLEPDEESGREWSPPMSGAMMLHPLNGVGGEEAGVEAAEEAAKAAVEAAMQAGVEAAAEEGVEEGVEKGVEEAVQRAVQRALHMAVQMTVDTSWLADAKAA